MQRAKGRRRSGKGVQKKTGKLGGAAGKAKQTLAEARASEGEAIMAEEARQLGQMADAAANQVEQRAREARQMAEATVEEPMRARIRDVEIQARAAGRELFKDLVLEGVAGDKISSLWIAKYVSKHGLI